MEKCFLYDSCNKKDCGAPFCLRKYKMDDLYNNSLLSANQRKRVVIHVDADGTDYNEFLKLSDMERNIVSFVESGKNLFLHSSNCGNGKTTFAIRLIQAYFNKIWPRSSLGCHALFIDVPSFLIALKNNISNHDQYAQFIKENIMRADLVVFDDIAAKVGSTFEIDQLLSYINGRIALGKSNIYTSNLSFKEMQQALGDRLASRICQLSIDVELHGSDKRSLVKEGV